MARFLRRRWQTSLDIGSGISRRDRRSCDYEAYAPDTLTSRAFTFDSGVTADVADAERAIARLNEQALTLIDTEALARLLLRAESVASSRIEGLKVGARRLLRADAAQQLGETLNDVTAAEVLANIDAMSFAIQTIDKEEPISTHHLLEAHRRLLCKTRLSDRAGRIRTEQNWIGGSSYNPCSAAFVPPPPEMIEELLKDLCIFCNDDSLPTVAQAAIAHAQFETIHPFVDGNGRVGRTLIHMILRKRGLAPRVLPPVSLILATWANDYIEGLSATRYIGASTSPAAHDGINLWVGRFASACRRAAADANTFETQVRRLQDEWRKRLGSVRSGSAVDILLKKLPGLPLLTVQSAANLIERSVQSTNEAVTRLVEARILSQMKAGQRNRTFETPDLIKAFTDLERRLASPAGDTRTSEPARRVPYRSLPEKSP